MKIVLGSSSPWRKRVMQDIVRSRFAEAELEIVAPDIDEKAFRSDDAHELTLELAMRKCAAVRDKASKPAIIVTFDQVIVCNGDIFEKPHVPELARTYLKEYRKHPALSVAAVYVLNTETGFSHTGVDEATVWFKDRALSDEAISEIIREGTVLTCAGGFSIGHKDFKEQFVLDVEGEFESVMGLPRTLTTELIISAMEEES